ncbi:MAG: IclR family transcriptional regulator C-terminal domain-containing protein [Phycisphaeraceae bacterium]
MRHGRCPIAKVVHKALSALIALADQPDHPLSLDELAAATGIARPTCARLLDDLGAFGFVEKVPTRRGYRLGPMSHQLTRRSIYRPDLLEIAEPIVAECARTIEESVVLSTLHRGRRYALLRANGSRTFEIRMARPYFDDLYATSTGRVLLAYAPVSEVDAFVARHGYPRADWNGIRSRRTLDQALADVRRRGFDVDTYQEQLTILTYPVWEGDTVVAALRAAMPLGHFVKPRSEMIQANVAEAAQKIARRLAARQPAQPRRRRRKRKAKPSASPAPDDPPPGPDTAPGCQLVGY